MESLRDMSAAAMHQSLGGHHRSGATQLRAVAAPTLPTLINFYAPGKRLIGSTTFPTS
ncbi:hypothetical protein [Nocardia sp. NPDC051463]|uniref:hypothetical protein n=1 Tax=Nocardia sp. NPDC051463 TaxID=3154845 RepID=UPI00341EAF92